MEDDEKRAGGTWGSEVELFRLIVESAEDYAIFTTDLERRVTSWNIGAVRLMGWSEAEVVGQSADLLFTPEDRKKGDQEKEFEEAYARGRADNKRWHLRKDGSRFWGVGSMHLLEDDTGHARGFAHLLRDRTDEHRADEARREAERRKFEFLALLAHELRNPLAATGNACRLSLHPEVDAKTIRCAKEIIARQVQNLTHLIDDLLDVSRITLGKIQLRKEPLHVGAIIARAVEAVSHLVEEKNHELNVSVVTEPMRVHADPTRLEQIVSNLLINAAIFTDTEGSIIARHIPIQAGSSSRSKTTASGFLPRCSPRCSSYSSRSIHRWTEHKEAWASGSPSSRCSSSCMAEASGHRARGSAKGVNLRCTCLP